MWPRPPSVPSSWPVGLVEAENNTWSVTFDSDSEAWEEIVAVTGDTCSPEDSGSTPVEGDMNMNFDNAVGNHWLCFHSRTVTETHEDTVDWHCGKCGDKRDRDRSGQTRWQVWIPTRQRQKWTDTVASVETVTRQRQKVKLKQDPALSF